MRSWAKKRPSLFNILYMTDWKKKKKKPINASIVIPKWCQSLVITMCKAKEGRLCFLKFHLFSIDLTRRIRCRYFTTQIPNEGYIVRPVLIRIWLKLWFISNQFFLSTQNWWGVGFMEVMSSHSGAKHVIVRV